MAEETNDQIIWPLWYYYVGNEDQASEYQDVAALASDLEFFDSEDNDEDDPPGILLDSLGRRIKANIFELDVKELSLNELTPTRENQVLVQNFASRFGSKMLNPGPGLKTDELKRGVGCWLFPALFVAGALCLIC